jgi:DNA-binding MarR family transcriptional regulator
MILDSRITKLPASMAEIGKTIFVRPARLHIAHWILETQERNFFAADISRSTGIAQSVVWQELQKFARLGMIRRLPRRRGRKEQYYRRVPDPAWEIFQTTAEIARRRRRSR